MTTVPIDEHETDVKQRIAAVIGTALFVAGLLLVMVVLPAEYGVDPLGVGRHLGLLPLGVVGQQVDTLNAAAASRRTSPAAAVVDDDHPYHEETVDFQIAPHEFMEYKYRLDQGRTLLYSWTATSPVNYELHAEPDGAPRGYAESYETRAATRDASGTLTAPFAGIHGWYWENAGDQMVTVTLKTAGFYTMSHEFRKDQPVRNKMFSR